MKISIVQLKKSVEALGLDYIIDFVKIPHLENFMLLAQKNSSNIFIKEDELINYLEGTGTLNQAFLLREEGKPHEADERTYNTIAEYINSRF